MSDSLREALDARTDLDVYGDNKRLLFALQISFVIEDIHSVAAQALTDGMHDKKCDLVYVDAATSRAVVAQAYEARHPKRVGKANKASDLNTAVSWLLGQDQTNLPSTIAAAAQELRESIEADEISTLEIWFVHNSPESIEVDSELQAVATTTRGLISQHFGRTRVENVTAREVGINTLGAWYRGTQVPILVSDSFTIPVDGYLEESGDKWKAICASVPAKWLNHLFQKHADDLFSANVRGYLGSRKTTRNINHNIKETAQHQPQRFWAYNNGLTALVNDFSYSELDGTLTIRGIAIVNGAQTTGAIGNVEAESLGDAHVLARFVKCDDAAVIREITKFNNSQNKIDPADFRSNDPVQERLRLEFANIGDVQYSGARRGGADDVIRRPGENMIASSTAAQSLAAFHQEPDIAYNQKGRIWENDQLYGRFFSDRTSARHIMYGYALLKAVESAKLRLAGINPERRTQSQYRSLEFFSQRGSTFLLVAAISSCSEIYLNRVIPDTYSLRFSPDIRLSDGILLWDEIVTPGLALNNSLRGALERNLKVREKVTESLADFAALFEATRDANADKFAEFAKHVES